MAEQGHYAGRTTPSDTRQGIYAFAPSGRLLGSVNTRDARRVADLLDTAFRLWEALPESERYLDPPPDAEAGLSRRPEQRYPAGGLALEVHARDVPRAAERDPAHAEATDGGGSRRGRRRGRSRWKQHAWNQDYAWFRPAEMRAFIPKSAVVGSATVVPEQLARRLARLHFVDNVRGQVSAFEDEHIEAAEIRTRVTAVDEERLVLAVEGRTRVVAPGLPDPAAADSRDPGDRERGIETEILGTAVWLRRARRFERFEVVALGTRWGGTRFNGRERDLAPQPIGFALTLAPDTRTVAPAFLWKYEW